MIIGVVKSHDWDEAVAELMNVCDKCSKPNPPVDYKGNKYCNWYCAKKG